MACACKVNQEINKISRYYSYNKEKSENTPRMAINKKDAATDILIYLLFLPFVPFIFLFVILFSIFSNDGMISMKKFLGFIHKARNGREQQVI